MEAGASVASSLSWPGSHRPGHFAGTTGRRRATLHASRTGGNPLRFSKRVGVVPNRRSRFGRAPSMDPLSPLLADNARPINPGSRFIIVALALASGRSRSDGFQRVAALPVALWVVPAQPNLLGRQNEAGLFA